MCKRLSRNPLYPHFVLFLALAVGTAGCTQENMKYRQLREEIDKVQAQLAEVREQTAELSRERDPVRARWALRARVRATLAGLPKDAKWTRVPNEAAAQLAAAHLADRLETASPAEVVRQIRESRVDELFGGAIAQVMTRDSHQLPDLQRAMNATVGQFEREVLPAWRTQAEERVDLSLFTRVRDHLQQLNIPDDERDKQTRRDDAVAAIVGLIEQADVVLKLSGSLKQRGDQYHNAATSIAKTLDSLPDEPTEAERERLAEKVAEEIRSILPSAPPTAEPADRVIADVEQLVAELVVLRHRGETALEKLLAVAQDHPSDSFLQLVIQPDDDPGAANDNLSHNIGKIVKNAQNAVLYLAGATLIVLLILSAPVWAIVVVFVVALAALVYITILGIDKMAKAGGRSERIEGPEVEPPTFVREPEPLFPVPVDEDPDEPEEGEEAAKGVSTTVLPGETGDVKVTWRRASDDPTVLEFAVEAPERAVVNLTLKQGEAGPVGKWFDDPEAKLQVDSIHLPDDPKVGLPVTMELSRAGRGRDRTLRKEARLSWDAEGELEISLPPVD